MGTPQRIDPVPRRASCAVAEEVGRATHSTPLQLLQCPNGGLTAACWRNPPVSTHLQPPDRHMLIFHQRGSTAIEARIGSAIRGHGSRIGSVTFVPAGTPSHWTLQGFCDVIHIYLDPGLLRKADGSPQALAPAFALEDPWLKHWFGLLSSEMNLQTRNGEMPAPLLADEYQSLLVSHLANADSFHHQPRGGLPRGAMRRIDEFLAHRLGDDLRLADLSAVACLSESHFIRAFRQSVGCTPWQHVLDRRLEAAENLMHGGMTAGEAARQVGLVDAPRLGRLYRQRRGVALALRPSGRA